MSTSTWVYLGVGVLVAGAGYLVYRKLTAPPALSPQARAIVQSVGSHMLLSSPGIITAMEQHPQGT